MLTVVLVAAWLLVGVAVAMYMVRRGHSPYLWLILTTFGPLAILFAWGSRDDEVAVPAEITHRGEPGAGPIHLLIGIDGTPASLAAAQRAVQLFGSSIGRVTVTAVLDYETPETHPRRDATDEADAWLVEAAKSIEADVGHSVDRVVLFGDPATEIARWAHDHGMTVIAVATRSHGTTRHLLSGRVTTGVLHDATCPVIVIPPEDQQRRAEITPSTLTTIPPERSPT